MSDFWKKALEAAGWTFLQVFVVTLAASIPAIDVMAWEKLVPVLGAAAMAAAGAALSIIKSMVVRNLGTEDSTLISG